MSDDPLKTLLQEADHAAGTPRMDADDLSERVFRGVRRRQRRRRISAAISIAVIGVGTAVLVRAGFESSEGPRVVRRSINDATVDDVDRMRVDRLRDEYKRLQITGDSKIALLRRVSELHDQQSRLAAYAEAPHVDLARIAQSEAEVTARLIVYRADRIYREPPRRAAAIQAYQRAIALFPNTAWADIARQRLTQVHSIPGEST